MFYKKPNTFCCLHLCSNLCGITAASYVLFPYPVMDVTFAPESYQVEGTYRKRAGNDNFHIGIHQ